MEERTEYKATTDQKEAPDSDTVERLVIKPCPFCGNADLEMWDTVSEQPSPNQVYCRNCMTNGPMGENTEEGIALWNERAL